MFRVIAYEHAIKTIDDVWDVQRLEASPFVGWITDAAKAAFSSQSGVKKLTIEYKTATYIFEALPALKFTDTPQHIASEIAIVGSDNVQEIAKIISDHAVSI